MPSLADAGHLLGAGVDLAVVSFDHPAAQVAMGLIMLLSFGFAPVFLGMTDGYVDMRYVPVV